MIKETVFGTVSTGSRFLGREARLFTLESTRSPLSLTLSDFGARVVSINLKSPDGRIMPLCAGYDTLRDYEIRPGYLGATVGRFGNRISGAAFELNGETYRLYANNGRNHLHGGRVGFDQILYTTVDRDDDDSPSVTFASISADGDEGYPGNLSFAVRYSLYGESGFKIDYQAFCDRDTPLNLTNHTYFNLAGTGSIASHILRLDADRFLPVDRELIPTGEIMPVDGTPFDFRSGRTIAETLDSGFEQISAAGGIDHCFVFREDKDFRRRARVYSPESGIYMYMLTDRPAVQVYSGNFMDDIGCLLSNGEQAANRHAFCLETEGYPDAPNRQNFPSSILKAGKTFRSSTAYEFGFSK